MRSKQRGNPPVIDSHCHLTDPRLLSQLDAVLSRAAAAGVERMITIGTNPADWDAVFAVVRDRANVRCAVGVHPNYCHEVEPAELGRLRELQKNPSVVALGEMGLDYHYDLPDRARQRRFFESQLQLAAELGRPVIIHCREAVADTLEVLAGFAQVPAVFHCYTGTLAESQCILEARLSARLYRRRHLQEFSRASGSGATNAGRSAAGGNRRALPHARTDPQAENERTVIRGSHRRRRSPPARRGCVGNRSDHDAKRAAFFGW